MYILKSKVAFISIVAGILSTIFCPFLKVFLVGNWNMFEVDERLFYITNGILALLLILTFFKRASLYRFVAIVFFVWCLLAIIAVFFKTNNYFGMKLADGLISKTISFKWGWAVLIMTALINLLSVRKEKTQNIIVNEGESNK